MHDHPVPWPSVNNACSFFSTVVWKLNTHVHTHSKRIQAATCKLLFTAWTSQLRFWGKGAAFSLHDFIQAKAAMLRSAHFLLCLSFDIHNHTPVLNYLLRN
jgi:hypothetical protein